LPRGGRKGPPALSEAAETKAPLGEVMERLARGRGEGRTDKRKKVEIEPKSRSVCLTQKRKGTIVACRDKKMKRPPPKGKKRKMVDSGRGVRESRVQPPGKEKESGRQIHLFRRRDNSGHEEEGKGRRRLYKEGVP